MKKKITKGVLVALFILDAWIIASFFDVINHNIGAENSTKAEWNCFKIMLNE